MNAAAKNDTTWTDQPAEILKSPLIGVIQTKDHIVEVRGSAATPWYVTIGTLFGSQTVACVNAESAIRAIAHASAGHKGKAPAGCTLMPQGTHQGDDE